MASEYQLNLKAVLDSTQVQEELNKLRQSASQGLGGENAPSGAPAQSGNLTNLGSTLNNLNQALNRLNQTLGQLRGTAAAPSRTATSTGGPIPVPFGGGQLPAAAAQRVFNDSLQHYDWLKKRLSSLPPSERLSAQQYGINLNQLPYELLFGKGGQSKIAMNLLQAAAPGADLKALNFNRLLASSWIKSQGIPNYFRETFVQSEYANYLKQLEASRRQQDAARKDIFRSANMRRIAKLFGGQYLAGELGNLGESIGGRTGAIISGGTEAAQSGLMTGVSMSMMGAGPATAAAAGIAAAAAKISSVMLEYAQKLAQAADKSYALLSRSKEQIEEQYKTAESIRFSRGLRNKDATELTQLRSQYETTAETAYGRYQSLVEGQQASLQQARQEYLDKLNEASSADDRIRIEQEYADAVANIVQSVGKAKEQWEESARKQQEINAALEDVKREYKDRRSYRYYLDRRGAEGYSDVDVAGRSSQWSQRASRIQEELNAEIAKNDMSEAGRQRRAHLQSLYGEYQSEADFWEKQSGSRKSAVETVQKDILVQERIKEIENLTKQYDFSRSYSSVDNRDYSSVDNISNVDNIDNVDNRDYSSVDNISNVDNIDHVNNRNYSSVNNVDRRNYSSIDNRDYSSVDNISNVDNIDNVDNRDYSSVDNVDNRDYSSVDNVKNVSNVNHVNNRNYSSVNNVDRRNYSSIDNRDYSSVDNRKEILADFESQRLNIRDLYMQSQQNVFEFQKQMMEALRKAASTGISQEERTKTLEEAGVLDERIQHEKNKMGVFQQAYTQLGGLKVEELQDVLSNLQAPSKDRATSLAQYGYNMGEKNDDDQRWQSELQYLKDQKQLQDDIKTILNDKLPSPGTFA